MVVRLGAAAVSGASSEAVPAVVICLSACLSGFFAFFFFFSTPADPFRFRRPPTNDIAPNCRWPQAM